MLFDIESFDYSYYDEGSEGLKVALVHHLDMPIMRQTGFHIGNRYNSTNTTLQIKQFGCFIANVLLAILFYVLSTWDRKSNCGDSDIDIYI